MLLWQDEHPHLKSDLKSIMYALRYMCMCMCANASRADAGLNRFFPAHVLNTHKPRELHKAIVSHIKWAQVRGVDIFCLKVKGREEKENVTIHIHYVMNFVDTA